MKNKVIIGIVAGIVLLAGGALRVEASDSFNTGIMPLKEVVTNSPIIVYASVDTNSLPTIHLTITEIWKGTNFSNYQKMFKWHWNLFKVCGIAR